MRDVDSYYTRTRRETRAYPPLDRDLDVDTLVIGGGLAGCATALDLAERGASVALIEARHVGWGASGRNGGFASEVFPGGFEALVARVGPARARGFQTIARNGLDLVRQRIARYAIQCGPNVEGALRCNIARGGADLPRHRDFVAEVFGIVYDHWPRDKVRAALSTELYDDALFIPSTFAVHPLDLTCGLARAAAERGAAVFETTPAVALTSAGGRKTVRTAAGTIRADRLVVTCGGYVEGLQGAISRATVPIATFVMTTEPLGGHLRDAIRVPFAIYDNTVATNYYRPLADTRLLWGGRVLAWEPGAARIADLLRRDMVRFYPALADARVEVAWGGMMPFTRHQLPVVGQIEPDVWYATGFGGLGVTMTTALGRLIAGAITDGDDRWRMFSTFGLPFAGGKLGKIPAQAIYWGHRLRGGRVPGGALAWVLHTGFPPTSSC